MANNVHGGDHPATPNEGAKVTEIVEKKSKVMAKNVPGVDHPATPNEEANVTEIVEKKTKVKAKNEPNMAETDNTVDPNAPGYGPKA